MTVAITTATGVSRNHTHLLDEHDELVEIARERDIKPRGLLQKDQSIVNGLNRFARGLLDYSRCSMTELEIFVQQRGITRKRWPSAAKLIAQLEAADDAREFVRLLELSSEVRLGIYKYYCSHFSHMGLCQPTPPPLADTCCQLRQDVLPVFYSQCIFQIHLTYPLPKCRLTSKTASYFMALNPAYLARIRKWQVCVYHVADSIDENTGPPEPCVEIKLNLRGTKYELRLSPLLHHVFVVDYEDDDILETADECHQLSQMITRDKLRPMLDQVVRREGDSVRLCMNGLYQIAWTM